MHLKDMKRFAELDSLTLRRVKYFQEDSVMHGHLTCTNSRNSVSSALVFPYVLEDHLLEGHGIDVKLVSLALWA